MLNTRVTDHVRYYHDDDGIKKEHVEPTDFSKAMGKKSWRIGMQENPVVLRNNNDDRGGLVALMLDGKIVAGRKNYDGRIHFAYGIYPQEHPSYGPCPTILAGIPFEVADIKFQTCVNTTNDTSFVRCANSSFGISPIHWVYDPDQGITYSENKILGGFETEEEANKYLSESFGEDIIRLARCQDEAQKNLQSFFEKDIEELKKAAAGKDRKGLRQMLASASEAQKALLIKQLTTDTPERLAEFEKAKKIRQQRLDSITVERETAAASKIAQSRVDKLHSNSEKAEQALKTAQKAHDSARETRKQAEQEFVAYRAKRRKSEHT